MGRLIFEQGRMRCRGGDTWIDSRISSYNFQEEREMQAEHENKIDFTVGLRSASGFVGPSWSKWNFWKKKTRNGSGIVAGIWAVDRYVWMA
ncbi:hypothetical protein KY290_021040 [Solanum tuberosum]|uniref:Uncharacterized protein n=1 Tax=Solanum tuberosum TaxID=4113 RepID=A0ABQ7V0D8_SOLTU|nr:hypothetical protein KY289_020223 [Solanum tuberosum]KAH0692888.1 hypothetical protein KY285_019985 [Solanum tuberosum]KAH0757547.1 hypothetical protein KY290_021040 [Solanum tuberosum]